MGGSKEFRQEVGKELTGREAGPPRDHAFKIYKRRILVIEQALETAALMRNGRISWLLLADDLRRLRCRRKSRRSEPPNLAAIDNEVFQLSA